MGGSLGPETSASDAPVDVTVAVCTRNRAARLHSLLDSLAALLPTPAMRWELLVVDNGSRDATAATVARYAERLPARRIHEPVAGHSRARNRVLEAARGDLVLWLDDDVIVPPDWLRAWVGAADAWPRAAFFGGPVRPRYEAIPPAWLRANLAALSGALAIVDLGGDVRPLVPGEMPFGANMATRRSALGGMRFDVGLGLVRRGQIRGEEIDLFERLGRQGGLGVWVGTAPVEHAVPAERMTARYVWRYFVGYGRTAVRRGAHDLDEIESAPAWMRSVRRKRLRQALWYALLRRDAWLPALIEAAQLHGEIRELAARPGAN